MTGAFADFGQQMTTGAKAYIKEHGDTVAGRKIELVIKDVGGPSPDVSKRLAQELVVKDNVDFIAGFGLTPNALAVAPIATEAKKPTIIMNAATSIITTKSPYMTRVSMTLPQVTAPLGDWAFKNGIRKVYTAVADYGPGFDAEAAFKKSFTGGRRRDRRRGAHAADEPGLRSVRAADQGHASPTRCSCSCRPASRRSAS